MDSFKDLLTETVGHIKRANEYFAEQQMKEIKKLKYSEPRKFKKKANEDQFQRIHKEEEDHSFNSQQQILASGNAGVHLKFTDATPASYVKRSCFSPSRRPSVGTCFACGKRSCYPTMDKPNIPNGFMKDNNQVHPCYVALYLQHLIEESHSPCVVDSAVYGSKWAHTMAGIPSPMDKPIIEGVRFDEVSIIRGNYIFMRVS
ncbi:unnamed protein product [Porites evermanni]|uniref:Uncharacterized protein n=1 Tax=Porites evermanni TaxID=104178 RepID=A0ABN8LWM4_9CNID|nr:unnamed protein product [Porites evermanni]